MGKERVYIMYDLMGNALRWAWTKVRWCKVYIVFCGETVAEQSKVGGLRLAVSQSGGMEQGAMSMQNKVDDVGGLSTMAEN